jgi:hypothetical protein
MHGVETRSVYTVSAVLFYTDPIPAPGESGAEPIRLPEPKIIDRTETTFEMR